MPFAARPRGQHELRLAQREACAAHDAGDTRRVRDTDGEQGVDGARPQRRDDQQRQQQRRERQHRVHHAHHKVVEPAADVAGGQSDRHAERQTERDRPEAQRECRTRSRQRPTQQIAAVLICPEHEPAAWRLQPIEHVLLGRRIRRDPRRREAHRDHDDQDRATRGERG